MQLAFIKNFFKLGIFKYSEDLLLFVGSMIISRLVGPSEYGVVAVVNVFYGFLSRFADVGLTAFIIREKDDGEQVAAVQFFFLLLGVLLGSLLLVLAYPVSLMYSPAVLAPCLVYAFIIVVQALPRASSAVLLKEQRFNFIAGTGVISTIVSLSVTVCLAFLGFSYWSLILPQFCPPLVSLYLYRRRLVIPFRIPSREQRRRTFQQCRGLIKNLTIFTALNYWARNTDNFFIGQIYGEARLGLYNRAYSFSNLPLGLIGNVFSKIQLPIFQKSIHDRAHIHFQYKQLLQLLTSVITVPFLVLYLFAEPVVRLLWGETWLEVIRYLPLLSILMLVFIINITVNDMLILFKKDKYIVVSAMITGLSTIISLTVGVFHSIEVMIYIYILNVLLVNSMTVIYIGFYKSFAFTVREILQVWLCNWGTAFSLILLEIFALREYRYIPLAVLTVVSAYKFIQYIKHLRVEIRERKRQ